MAQPLPGGVEAVVPKKPGESDFDWRARVAADPRVTIEPGSPLALQLAEDEAIRTARRERRSRVRRRGGPTGYGATILTSPLGVPGPSGGAALSLLGSV